MKREARRAPEERENERTVFVCEDSVDGIFTAVYDAWASRLGLRNVSIQAGESQDRLLFTAYRTVETDHEKAASVADTLRRKMGMEDFQTIYQAALSGDGEKGEDIFRTIVLGLAVWKRKNITRNLQEPSVLRVFERSRAVENEAHKYRMFVRFREMENGLMCAEIEPENQVLPLLGDHFSDRFPMVNFLIYDHTYGQCLFHQAHCQWAILTGVQPEERQLCRFSEQEREYARLWKGFVDHIAIQERKNPRCQMNFMPKKYWKYMTEHTDVY